MVALESEGQHGRAQLHARDHRWSGRGGMGRTAETGEMGLKALEQVIEPYALGMESPLPFARLRVSVRGGDATSCWEEAILLRLIWYWERESDGVIET